MKELEFHDYANLFPLIEGEAFDELVADIATNGIREPIVLWQGKILDGRNRYRAAVSCGLMAPDGTQANGPVSPITLTRQFVPQIEGHPLTFVLSLNLHRRHLDESQRAMVATRLATLGHGGARPGKMPIGTLAQGVPETPPAPAAMTIAAAAQALNVSERSVKRARVVAEQGAPELVAAADAGTVAVSVAAELARLPVEDQREVLRSASPSALYRVIKDQRDALTAQKKTKRAEKEKVLGAKQRALPAKKYGVIYADPAWRWDVRSEDTGRDRGPENHYPTMSTEEICALPVGNIAASDCVLFMWATAPKLPDALSVIHRWGFTYKSQIIWIKDAQDGTGYWFRNKHELLLVATRGNIPAPALGTQWSSVLVAPRGEHSSKPEPFAELIEQYFPTLPKIELNARKARPGWDVWGNEAPEGDSEFEEIVASLRAAPAHCVVEHRGIRAIVETGGHGPAIYALDLNRPFPSETGFHSLLGSVRMDGETIEDFGRRLIDDSIAYSEKSRGKTKALMLPERAYTLQLDDKGHPTSRKRGVWVDRDAPPLGLDIGLIEGLDVILARWKEEDSAARYAGRKAKRTCPESLHRNDKIIAVYGQALKPVADFPTEGAYVVTGFKWVDGNRVEGWRFVDEAAFHDDTPEAPRDFADAPADGEDIAIPAFLRRERCPDTADMFEEEAR